ncbi:MAG: alcohol dehydrogenase catalytic domain-containing protein, partial [Myxococcota bacterium]|nr:alcohol dehydrogenase catalytic domain-containing protein [Myxococcota bacterium]
RVDAVGEGVEALAEGDRVGVPWLGHTCGECRYCRADSENLCDEARFTGAQIDGGFAEACVADARFCLPIPEGLEPVDAAPLLCAGLIGFRSYRIARHTAEERLGETRTLGLYGFGAAAHLLCQVAVDDGLEVHAFTRPGDEEGQDFARSLGARWAGGSDEAPPTDLDAAILFAPVGELVPEALRRVVKGGAVVCAGIHMSEIPAFPYRILWGERVLRSVANLTREDGVRFLDRAEAVPVETSVTCFPLERAGEALEALREGDFDGAAVLTIEG